MLTEKVEKENHLSYVESKSDGMSDLNDYDAILNEKIKLVNRALDEIGFTWYHVKLFCLNGMGYATDSQLSYVQSTVAAFTRAQFGHQKYPLDSEALFIGLFVGALFWGFSADLIGRKTAFNSSLLLSSIFTFLTAAMGNWGSYCLFVALAAAAIGGNLVLDTTVFLEYLPGNYSWTVTFLALWWGVGQIIATLVGWGLLASYSCDNGLKEGQVCLSSENRGWRYTYAVNAAIVMVFSILRILMVRLKETPKFLVSNGRDEEAVEVLQLLATKYNRSCFLTVDQLKECGDISHGKDEDSWIEKIKFHLSILFQNRKTTRSNLLLYLSWLLLGLAYPLYSNFLPTYLSTKGANISASTTSGKYRDNVIPNVGAIGGPMIAGALLYFFPKSLGHRGTMIVGALGAMICFFGYTQIKTRSQNLALSTLVYIFIDIYYGCLYAYTPSVLPSAARATGNSLAFGFTRGMACIVPVIAYYSDTTTSIPIWICGAAVGVIGLLSLFYPFEPSRMRSV